MSFSPFVLPVQTFFMQASQDRISYLFKQHFAGNLSSAEQDDFFALIDKGEQDAAIKELMANAWQEYAPSTTAPVEWSKAAFEKAISKSGKVHFLKTAWFRYAAIIILVFSIGAIFWPRTQTHNTLNPGSMVKAPDIPPGHDGALLTLADGSQIVLDSFSNRQKVATQKGTSIVYDDGQLTYSSSEGYNSEVLYNTVSTPRGRQFQLILPDGSKVWLNAASSIKFPTNLSGLRQVEVTGEAYFEVKENRKEPFLVTAGNTQVQVLGTSFNINSYEEKVKATLIDGSVVIRAMDQSKKLKPGQQSVTDANGLTVQTADIGQVLAWKNGLFDFKDATLAEVMRQLARWYNINVKYENGIPDIGFEGKLGRDVSFSKMLVFFRESGVDFRMENGNTLVIIKKI